MGVNKKRLHVYVLPEDDANRQIANEFLVNIDISQQRQMYVLDAAGGWTRVLKQFESVHVTEMNRCQNRFTILLIDFDEDANRLQKAKAVVPYNLQDRVFILGSWRDPEALRKAGLCSYEVIGLSMANDCRHETNETWSHELLRQNAAELDRLRLLVRPILFPPASNMLG